MDISQWNPRRSTQRKALKTASNVHRKILETGRPSFSFLLNNDGTDFVLGCGENKLFQMRALGSKNITNVGTGVQNVQIRIRIIKSCFELRESSEWE